MCITNEIREKVHPRRGAEISGQFAAILAFMVGEDDFTTPSIAEMMVTVDGHVIARTTDDILWNAFIGSVDDLWRNLTEWGQVTGLDANEWSQFVQHCDDMLQDHRIVGRDVDDEVPSSWRLRGE